MAPPTRRTVLLAALAAAACASCGGDEMDGTGNLVFVDGRDTSRDSQIKKLVQAWNDDERNAGEQVSMLELSESTDDQRAQTMKQAQDFRAGLPCYDVIMLDVVFVAEFAHWKYILPLDEDAIGHNTFLPKPMEAVRYNGKVWAVPFRSDVGLLYYREDLLNAGSPPANWDDLRRQAMGHPRPEGVQGYVTQLRRYEGFAVNVMEAVWDSGGAVLSPDGKTIGSSDSIIKGFARLRQGIAEGWIPKRATELSEESSRVEFQDGRAMFLRNWTYAHPLLADPNSPVADTFGVATLPTGSALGGWNLAISRCSQRRATALRFIRYMTNERNQRTLFTQAGFAPSRTALYEDEELLRRHPHLSTIRRAIDQSHNRGSSPYYHQISRILQSRLHDNLNGEPVTDSRELVQELLLAAEGHTQR